MALERRKNNASERADQLGRVCWQPQVFHLLYYIMLYYIMLHYIMLQPHHISPRSFTYCILSCYIMLIILFCIVLKYIHQVRRQWLNEYARFRV
jgi:hypothetical protein